MKEFNQKPIVYNTKWPEIFNEEAAKLRIAFGDELLSLHHIGSTAIPGLLAKPIIDMIGEVKDISKISSFENQLNKMGYAFKAEYGIPDRAYFSRKEQPSVHLHLFPQKHFQVEKHILFRDFLLKNPNAVNDYAQCKQELLRNFPDSRENYQQGKNNFILDLTQKA